MFRQWSRKYLFDAFIYTYIHIYNTHVNIYFILFRNMFRKLKFKYYEKVPFDNAMLWTLFH